MKKDVPPPRPRGRRISAESYAVDAHYPTRRSAVMGASVVSTSEPRAAQAGAMALAQGGNAVDAALATAIALTVTEPVSNGLGSDAFALVWDGKRLHGLNASGRAPAGWAEGQFGEGGVPFRGWNSVTVPGAVSAWVTLSERFGRLPFEDLFEAAIRHARDGFLVSPVVAASWQAQAADLAGYAGFADTFMPGGRSPRAGEVFRAPHMAHTLEEIARTRGASFYRGRLAEAMAAHAADHDADLSLADFEAHRPDWVEPLSVPYGEVTVHELPPNGQGIAALIALGLLDRLDLGPTADDPLTLHLEIEALKIALADAYAHVADPEHMRIDPADLVDPARLDRLAAGIDPRRASKVVPRRARPGGTVLLVAGDADGMMVSFIQSNYAGFGSGIVVPGTGISLQNRAACFTAEPGHPNAAGPGKRPFHTIIPGFLMDADGPVAAFGVMGGEIQAQGHAQVVVRMERYGQDPQTAADAPRFRILPDGRLALEPTMASDVVRTLSGLGHPVAKDAIAGYFGFGGAQILRRLEGGYAAGSDPRKDGQAVAL